MAKYTFATGSIVAFSVTVVVEMQYCMIYFCTVQQLYKW